jgi:hypothetical protein
MIKYSKDMRFEICFLETHRSNWGQTPQLYINKN